MQVLKRFFSRLITNVEILACSRSPTSVKDTVCAPHSHFILLNLSFTLLFDTTKLQIHARLGSSRTRAIGFVPPSRELPGYFCVYDRPVRILAEIHKVLHPAVRSILSAIKYSIYVSC